MISRLLVDASLVSWAPPPPPPIERPANASKAIQIGGQVSERAEILPRESRIANRERVERLSRGSETRSHLLSWLDVCCWAKSSHYWRAAGEHHL